MSFFQSLFFKTSLPMRLDPVLFGSTRMVEKVPAGVGTLPTHTPLFIFFLIGVVVIVGALTFIPALALGPVVEHLALYGAK